MLETKKGTSTRRAREAPDPFAQPESILGAGPIPLHPAQGPERLANFLRAPAATQRRFAERIAKATNARHFASAMRICEDADFYPSPEAVNRLAEALGVSSKRLYGVPLPVWDRRWADRAYYDRLAEQRGRKLDPSFDEEKARLTLIPAEEYVERLTGEEVSRSRTIHCPLPGHDERTPSFHVRDTTWRCFGCDKRGSIYDLAGELWGLQRHGTAFMDIHRRLIEVFL